MKKNALEFLKKLKPFFDFRVQTLEDALSILLGISVFGVILFNAYFIDITYDEAYTYLNTGRIQDVWKIYLFRIANTHVLNSLLMTLTTLFFPYNDFAIRLPSVFISVFYISISISIAKKYTNQLITLGLLLLFYYVIEFMALARGYGMSATFILAAFFVYKQKTEFSNYYLWIMYLLLLALYANYVAIVPFGIMVAYLFVIDFKMKLPIVSVKNRRWIIGLGLVALYGFYSVTKAGKPLYGAYTQTFFEAIPQDILMRFFDNQIVPIQYITYGTIILVVLVIGFFVKFKNKNPFGLITITTFAAIFVVSWVTNKPLPTGRVLVPYWPMIVLTIVEVLEIGSDKFRIPRLASRVFNVLIFGVLIFNFSEQLQFTKYVESKSVQWKIPINILAGYGKDIFPHDTYYLEKDLKNEIIPTKLKGYIPDTEFSKESVSFKTYDQLGLLTIQFEEDAKKGRMFRTVESMGQLIYSDTISVGEGIFELHKNGLLLLPYPRTGGEYLKIGATDGSWNQDFSIPAGMDKFFPIEKRHTI